MVLGLLAVGTAFADESPAARRERIERMGPEKKQQLLQREAEFESLAPSKQERIRKLHEELQNAPDAEQLRQVMRRYHEWLAALPSYQRAQLLELTPAERIKRIQEIRKEQAVANAWHPGAEDFKVIYRWQDDFAPKYESRLLEGVKDDQRQPWEKLDPVRRRTHVKWMMMLASERNRPLRPGPKPTPGDKLRPDDRKLPPITDDDLATLRTGLSAEAQKRLATAAQGEQWAVVGGWIRQEFRRQWENVRRRGPGTGPGGPGPGAAPSGPGMGTGVPGLRPFVDDEHLAEFFERDLTDAERDKLLELPFEQMQENLRAMYGKRYGMIGPPVRLPEGPPPWQRGKRPGPSGGERGGPRKTDKNGPPRFEKPARPEPPTKEPPASGP